MEIFYFTGIAVVITVGLLSGILARKHPSKKTYLLPGIILTAVSLLVAIITFFRGSDGWSYIGYSLLFIFVAVGSLLGTAIGKTVGGKADYRDPTL
ncbi:YesK family protein [Pradoshia sp.]